MLQPGLVVERTGWQGADISENELNGILWGSCKEFRGAPTHQAWGLHIPNFSQFAFRYLGHSHGKCNSSQSNVRTQGEIWKAIASGRTRGRLEHSV